MRKKPTKLSMFKDVTSYLGGWALLGYQVRYVPPAQVNEAFLWVAVVFVVDPPLTQLWQLPQLWQLRPGGKNGDAGPPPRRGSPPSPPPESPSPDASEGRP